MQNQKNIVSKCRTTYTIKKHGLTLIEVLLAIFIFGVGILWILHIMTQNIWLMDRTKLKTQAILLSQEAMELSFHHRDTNTTLGYNRACAQRDSNISETSWCSTLLTSGTSIFTIEQSFDWSYTLSPITTGPDFNTVFEESRLYKHTQEINNQNIELFNHEQQDWIPSYFARIIQFDPVDKNLLPKYLEGKIIKTTVTTFYMKGSLTWSVVLESFLGERVY